VGRRGLGRGLSALISTGESVGGLKFEELPISAIRPNAHQPRRSFGEEGIRELAASIREVGILQPLVIRSTETGFELIAGERRLRAAREAGLDRVPVLIRQAETNESMELALVENLQREDLNPLETASAYSALIDSLGLTKEQLANRLGKSRAAVTNTLRLAQLPDEVKAMMLAGKLTEGHARPLLSLGSEEQMVRLAQRVVADKLSVRKTEELVRDTLAGREEPKNTPAPESPDGSEPYAEASRIIQDAISLPVRIRAQRKGGKLEIRFKDPDQLDGLLLLLTSAQD
jgi:ParB family transcriptional regulator, chromosome partitioning protein